MKQILFSILPFGLLISGMPKEGRVLYLEAQCQKCHLQDAKFDPNSTKKEGVHSKVGNMKQVKKWVVSCDNYFDIGWFPEDQEKVAAYLNSVHYKYDTKGSKK